MSYAHGCRIGTLLLVCLFPVPSIASAAEPFLSDRNDVFGDPLPLGALARMGTVRMRTGNSVECVAFSADGKIFATGEELGTIRFWDPKTGKQIRAVKLGGVFVLQLVLSSDGRHFAASVDRQGHISRDIGGEHQSLFVGDVATGKVLYRFDDNRLGFRCVQFTADGKLLSAVKGGGWLRRRDDSAPAVIWSVADGKEVQTIDKVSAFGLAPDGKTAAVGRSDGTITTYQIATGKEITSWKAHEGPVSVVEFSPDGKTLASSLGVDEERKRKKEKESDAKVDYSVRLWDPTTQKELRSLPDQGRPTEELVFSPDGKKLASFAELGEKDEGARMNVWSTATGEFLALKDPELQQSRWISFSPDSNSFLCGPRRTSLVDIASGKVIRHFGRKGERIGQCRFSPDGKWLAGAGYGINLWEVESGKEALPFAGHRCGIGSMEFSADGKTLAALDESGWLRLWDVATSKVLNPDVEFAEGRTFAFAFAESGKALTVVGIDGATRRWDVRTSRKLLQFSLPIASGVERTNQPEDTLWFSPDGNAVAVLVFEDQEVQIWDLNMGKKRGAFRIHGEKRLGVRFAPDGKTLALLGDDQTIRIWNTASLTERACFRGKEDEHGAFAFSSDSNRLAWSWDGTVHVWDLDAEKECGKCESPAHHLDHLMFAPDGSKLTAVESDETVRTWDLRSGKEIHAFRGEGRWVFQRPRLIAAAHGPVLAMASNDPKNSTYQLRAAATGRRIGEIQHWNGDCFALSPSGKLIASGSDWVIIQDTANGRERAALPPGHRGRRAALAFSPDGGILASGGEEGAIILWDVSGLRKSEPLQLFTFSPDSLEKQWENLLPEAEKRDDAARLLLGDPERTVPFLRDKLTQIVSEDCERLRKWIDELGADSYETREKASEELAKLGKIVEKDLRKALDGSPSPEAKRRIAELLEKAEASSLLPGDYQRAHIAFFILSRFHTEASRKVIEELAKTKEKSWIGQRAKWHLEHYEDP
jgi:WD40 repeat protein